MKKLIKGILDFRQNCLSDYQKKFAHLKGGQCPDSLFVGCSDSRVMPNVFASTNPGDLFVVRNVGNLIPPHCEYTRNYSVAAAIEFALTQLPVNHVVVCGHSQCGAMQAALAGLEKIQDGNLKHWLQNIHCPDESKLEAYDKVLSDTSLMPENRLSQINVLQQMEHLKTYPVVKEKIDQNALQIHGWYFDIATGNVYAFDNKVGSFVLIDEEEGNRILLDIE